MSNVFVADTMAVVLRLERRKLPRQVRIIFEEAEQGTSTLFIPAMVLMEIGYLSEKRRIEATLSGVRNYCNKHPEIHVLSITQEIVEKCFTIDDIPELHDRLIAGTAYNKQCPLITNDPLITKSKFLSVIW